MVVLCLIVRHSEAIVQEELTVALLAVRVADLGALLDRSDGLHNKNLLCLVEPELAIYHRWDCMIEHVAKGHHAYLLLVHLETERATEDNQSGFDEGFRAVLREVGVRFCN